MKVTLILLGFATLASCGKLRHRSSPTVIPLDVRPLEDSRGFWDNLWGSVQGAVTDFANDVDSSIKKAQKELDALGKQIGSTFDGVKSTVDDIAVHLTNSTTFNCEGHGCELCFLIPKGSSKSELCVDVSLDMDNFGVKGEILLDDQVLIGRSISAKNPGPICIVIPHIPLLKVCVTPYEPELEIDNKNFQICLETGMAAFSKQLIAIDLNCFKLEGSNFYLAAPNNPPKGGLINLNAGKLVPGFDKKLKLFSI